MIGSEINILANGSPTGIFVGAHRKEAVSFFYTGNASLGLLVATLLPQEES